MANIIPKALKDRAKELGCNAINYVTTTDMGDIFSLAKTDGEGDYEPIGKPILYAVRGSSITPLDENQVYLILKDIKE